MLRHKIYFSDRKPLYISHQQLDRSRRGTRSIIRRSQNTVPIVAVGRQGEHEALALEFLVAGPEKLSGAMIEGGLCHDLCHMGLGQLEYVGRMEILERRTAEALPKSHHGAVARQSRGKITCSAIVLERPKPFEM